MAGKECAAGHFARNLNKIPAARTTVQREHRKGNDANTHHVSNI
jgi:hypothetical protein